MADLTTATIVFADVVGSTAQRVRLGGNAADGLHLQVEGMLRVAVEAAGGTVVKGEGDGVMASFASATAAVDAAVAMQRAVDRARLSDPVEIRVGLASGDVSIVDGDCFGLPVVTAARLCGAATPGSITCTSIVRVLAGSRPDHEFARVGELDLKGIDDPVEAFEVRWLRSAPTVPFPAELRVAADDPFVGRVEPRRLLDEALGRSADGLTLAFVAGEPGIGKTRLVAEFAAAAHESGTTVLFGRCDDELGVAYQPWAEALTSYGATLDDDALRDAVARVGENASELSRLVPGLRTRLPELPAPMLLSGEADDGARGLLFDAVASAFRVIAETGPLIVVLDDLHWAARETLLVLRHVVRAGADLPLLVVGTYRDTDLDRAHPLAEFLADLQRTDRGIRIALDGLGFDDVRALSGDHVDVEQVCATTGGNAFFVRSLLRHLQESGDDRLPEGVREVVGRRLTRLGAEANDVLALAAVAGADFEVAVLEQAAGPEGSAVVVPALEAALAAGLIEEAGPDRCRFHHALVRQTLLEEMTSMRRTRNHGRLAGAIETIHAGNLDGHLAELARHATESARAGSIDRAVDVSVRACDVALERLAFDEAEVLVQRALDVIDLDDPPNESLRATVLARLARLRVLALHDDAVLAFEAACRSALAVGDGPLLGRSLALLNYSALAGIDETQASLYRDWARKALDGIGPDEPAARAFALIGLRSTAMGGDWVDTTDEALELALESGEPDAIAQASFWPGMAAALAGDEERVGAILEQLREIGGYAINNALRIEVLLEVSKGDIHALGGPAVEELAGMAERLALPAHRAIASGFRRSHEVACGARLLDGEPARGLAEQSLPGLVRLGELLVGAEPARLMDAIAKLPERHQFWRQPANIRWPQAMAALHLGDPQPALAALDAYATGEEGEVALTWQLTWLRAELAAELGHSPSAATVLADIPPGTRILTSFQASMVHGAVDRFIGMMHSVLGDHDRAISHLRDGLELEAGQGATTLAAQSRYWLARALHARGAESDLAEARSLLDAVEAHATAIGMRSYLERSAALRPLL